MTLELENLMNTHFFLLFVVLKDLDDIKAANNTFMEKPYYYKFAQAWLGNGLVTAPSKLYISYFHYNYDINCLHK